MWNPDQYLTTLLFAAEAHKDQKIPDSNYNYVTHVTNVAMEVANALVQQPLSIVDTTFAIQCALLHDTIEDTPVTYNDVLQHFGDAIADGVLALTKNDELPKSQRMEDSLQRIVRQGTAVRIVKMADRINNLQHPPSYWTLEKKKKYHQEAQLILDTLGGVHTYIEKRLADKIKAYPQFF